MLDIEERFMIRDMYRTGVSISDIARKTGRDRKTIRQIVTAPDVIPEAKPRQPRARKIDPYVPYLEQRIEEGVLNARKLYGEIRAQGYAGGETQVRDFVHERRPAQLTEGVMRFETAPGEQGQVDWGHFGFISHYGQMMRLYAFVLTLGWSRASYVRFTVSMDIAWFIGCHLAAFTYLGGMPRILLYDNLKSVVLSRERDGTIHWNPRFLDFADVAGFSPRACQPYRAQTKGKVESGVKYVRNNCWPGLHFRDLADVNQQALTWLNTVANCRVHGTRGEVPFVRLPKEGLLPADKALLYDTSVITTRHSSLDCMISYGGNLYSIPAGHARQVLQVKVTEQEELEVFTLQGEELARHQVVQGHHQRCVHPVHFRGLPAPTRRRGRPSARTACWSRQRHCSHSGMPLVWKFVR